MSKHWLFHFGCECTLAALEDGTVSSYQNWEYTYPNFWKFHFEASPCKEIVKAVVPSRIICNGKKLDRIQLFISRVCVWSVLFDSFVTPWTVAHRLLCWWNFPSKNTGVGSRSLLQGTFPTQGLNLGLLHFRLIFHHQSHQGSPTKGQSLSNIPKNKI